MRVSVTDKPVIELEADAAILPVLEDQKSVEGALAQLDVAMEGAITAVLRKGDLKGKPNQVVVLYPPKGLPMKRVLLVGMGKIEELTPDQCRQACGTVVKAAEKLECQRITCLIHQAGAGRIDLQAAVQATVEGFLLGSYRSKTFKTRSLEHNTILENILVLSHAREAKAAGAGIHRGQIFADAVCTARDLVNQPANYMTPSLMADVAGAIAFKDGLSCEILNDHQIAALGMGALRGVAKGSKEPPRFIVLEHKDEEGEASDKGPTVVLVGKGITFDSGGLSLKPPAGMETMKSDMAGAAAVIGVLQGVARLGLPLRVVGLAPLAENLPSSTACKPGDVLKAMNGKTIEVLNTDAEGRLILADALCYAARYEPDAVIDLATLTGACVVALGEDVAAGIFATDDDLCAQLLAAGESTSEKIWRLPLYKEYRDKIKSEVADMKNTGGRFGGVGTSVALLQEFVTYPWAHIDIASMAFTKTATACTPKGGTGFIVRTLLTYLINRCGG